MKKYAMLFSVVMVVVMLFTMVSTAATTTYTLTINKEDAGHVYEAYQIFTGTLSEEDDGDLVLSTVVWGTGVTDAGKTALGNAQAKADSIKTVAQAEAFADEVAPYLTTVCKTANYDSENKVYTIENLAPGYYLIKDKDNSLSQEQGYTDFILKVVGDVDVTPKDGETTVIKKVDDKNDSNTSEDDIEWQDSADHDIGDAIDFKLEATVTENYDKYDSYYLALHDKEDAGLTFDPQSVVVSIDGVTLTSGYELVTEDLEDDCTFEVVFEDLKDTAAVAGSKIVVTYKSVLNENAVIGNLGNVNKVYGKFSNNPNKEDDFGRTPDDAVIVFTYTVEVNKVDENKDPLPGAQFTLEKFVADANGTETVAGVTGKWVALQTVETTPDTTFTFEGLDDGEYRLTETVAPTHYNAIEPILFAVTAEHDVLWETQNREDVLTSLSGDVATGEIQFTSDLDAGELNTKVVNNRGVILPETGGMGTTLFYLVGGLLLLTGIVLFFVIKFKKNTDN
jgi:fimbrial isopeptide formation D2 family protein/LPXTG-motif cell wall-anchored protein